MVTPKESQTGVATANELYWGSKQSVNKIAEGLELSKSALYDIIQPHPLGLSCPTCGREVVFANRTAREKGLATCSECDWEGLEDDTDPFVAERPVVLPTYEERGEVDVGDRAENASVEPFAQLDSSTTRTMAAGALLGAVAGLALVLWTWRR